MTSLALPVLYALFLWWFSTGTIFYLDARPARSFRWSMAGATVLLVAAIVGVSLTGADRSTSGAYLAFTCGLVAWGWLEMGYYLGFMVGPRRQASSDSTRGWRLLGEAIATTLYHEIAAVALMAVIGAMIWGMPNTIAFWTFFILWLMQLSAKFNVFLGVPNLGEAVLPAHLAFLRRYMHRKPMNVFFPLAVTTSLIATTLLANAALSDGASAAEAVGLTLLATLMALAVLEHWCLVVPVPVEALWRWALARMPEKADATQCPPTGRDAAGDGAEPQKRSAQHFADVVLSQPAAP